MVAPVRTQSLEQSGVSLTRLADIYGMSSLVVEYVDTDLLTEVNNLAFSLSFESSLAASVTPIHYILTPHETVVLDY